MPKFFDDWGTKENPITTGDLDSLFSGGFSCMKKFYLKHTTKKESKNTSYRLAFSEAIKKEIDSFLRSNFRKYQPGIEKIIAEMEKEVSIGYQESDRASTIKFYQSIMDTISEDATFKKLKSLKDHSGRYGQMGFTVKVGDFYLAGMIDVIVQREDGSVTVINWKTKKTVQSQYEMDHSYQSIINFLAVKKGVFFPSRNGKTGRDFRMAYVEMWDEEKTFEVYPKILFGHLQDMVPLKKKVTKKAKHTSSKNLADSDGNIILTAGDRRGPVFYEANVQDIDIATRRLLYSIDSSVKMAKAGAFPENWGPGCEKCFYRGECETLGSVNQAEQKDLLDIIKECQIDLEG